VGVQVHSWWQQVSLATIGEIANDGATEAVAVEAQLRGIPVISTDACGLTEANFLPELRVPNVRIVHDSRTRECLRGITMAEAERTLDPARPGEKSVAEEVYHQKMEEAHTFIATPEEASGFTERLQLLTDDPGRRREFGRTARQRAIGHVEGRRWCFADALKRLAAEPRDATPSRQ